MEFESYASNQIYTYAKRCGIKATPISYDDNLMLLEYKGKKELIKQVATRFTTIIQWRICDNKYLALKILRDNWILNVPNNFVIQHIDETKNMSISYPLVVKPLKWHGWIWISVGITNKKELKDAFLEAKKQYFRVLIEEYVSGEDYRFLVIDKDVRVCKRIPPKIFGDGKKTIKNLIDTENNLRKNINNLADIKIDNELVTQISCKWYTLESILPKWQELLLRKNANLSTWGTTIDYTDKVHKKNKKLALKIAKIMGMKMIAIDFMFKDVTQAYSKDNGIIIEINDTPWMRLHYPREKEIVHSIFKLLFPTLK